MKNPCLPPVAYCLLAVSFSCKQKTDYSKELYSLDSASVKLKEAEAIFLSADTGSFRTAYIFSKEKLAVISEKITKDTLNKSAALFLSDAFEQTGNVRNVLDNRLFLERAIREGQQRISDLKHDLEADLIDKNKSAEYIVNEVNASKKVFEMVNRTIANAKTSAARLDSMKTEITHLADSLTTQ